MRCLTRARGEVGTLRPVRLTALAACRARARPIVRKISARGLTTLAPGRARTRRILGEVAARIPPALAANSAGPSWIIGKIARTAAMPAAGTIVLHDCLHEFRRLAESDTVSGSRIAAAAGMWTECT